MIRLADFERQIEFKYSWTVGIENCRKTDKRTKLNFSMAGICHYHVFLSAWNMKQGLWRSIVKVHCWLRCEVLCWNSSKQCVVFWFVILYRCVKHRMFSFMLCLKSIHNGYLRNFTNIFLNLHEGEFHFSIWQDKGVHKFPLKWNRIFSLFFCPKLLRPKDLCHHQLQCT